MNALDGEGAVPRVSVGAVVVKDGRVLLVRRRNPPNAGLWCIPGGKVRWGETLVGAVEREIWEETGIRVAAGEPLVVLDAIGPDPVAYHFVIIDYIAHWRAGEPRAADDALAARWFEHHELTDASVEQRTRQLLEQCWARLNQYTKVTA